MRRVLTALVFLMLGPAPALAQEPVPDRRLVVTRDIDFYGADLQSLFDTTLDACQRVCLNDTACTAFTFNTRSRACFPKSSVSDRQPYDGAVSAQVLATSPGALASAAARAGDLGFLDATDLEQARAEAGALALRHAGGEWSVDQLLRSAREQITQGDMRGAMHWTGAALAQSDAPDLWLEYGQRATDLAATADGDARRQLLERAKLAAINAYLRADGTEVRVNALLALARALEPLDRGPKMIPALRLADSLQPRAEVVALLDAATGKYGFRILDTTVESDSAAPRICTEFSDPLVRAGTDYAPFVRLPDPRLVVQQSDRQICIDGIQHGTRYTLTFRAGLPSAEGEVLPRDVAVTLYVRDRSASVRFPGRAYVLARSADAGLPIETVNLSEVSLSLSRISDRNLTRVIQDGFFGRPLATWELDQFRTDLAEEIWTGQGRVENRLNADVTTRLPMGPVVDDLAPGIYALTATVPGADLYETPGATQWFILTDIGLTTLSGTDGLHVVARRLSDAAPLAGLDVTLLSRSNRELTSVRTDADGVARIAPGLMRGTGGADPALILARDGGTDLAFLSLRDPAFDLSDRGVAGREPSGPIDAFLATDRGAYRAGEVIHATALLRDGDLAAVDGLPVTAILTRPDGVEHARSLSAEAVAGGHVFDLPLAPSVPRGTWQLALHGDVDAPALARQSLLVEDFVPERIDVDLTLPDGAIRTSAPPLLDVSARYLFGAPGADLPIEGEIRLSAGDRLDAYPGYRFGPHDASTDSQTRSLPGDLRTDMQGKARIPLSLQDMAGLGVGRPYDAEITLRLTEGSGRPVERSISRPVAPAGPMIGIRPMFEDSVPQGARAGFSLLAVESDIAPARIKVQWTLNRIETRYQWYQLYGNWNWEPVTTRKQVARGTLDLGTDPVDLSQPVDWGRYELVVERLEGPYVASSVGFDAGWYAPADTAAAPDMLELSLDRPRYRPGETAMLRLVPRHAGKALVTVLSDHVISMQAVEVSAGETLIPLPVTDDWGAGAYVTAQVIRPMDVAAGQNPARSLGLAHAAIDPGARRLSVSIDTAGETAPRGPLKVVVRVDGLAEGQAGHVTLAAVDLGILNLTGFKSPDPSEHYFGQRRLGVEVRDLYGRLIDGMNGAMGQIRSGGDASAQMRMQAPPPTEATVAFFSGAVQVIDGRAEIAFDLPDFNGTVRLMALAWSPTAVGEASADVLVRDPVVISATLPRFLAPGDAARLSLEFVHVKGPTGRMALELSAPEVLADPSAIPSEISLAGSGRVRLNIPLSAGTVGDRTIRVALTTPDGTRLVRNLTLGIRANDPATAVTRRVSLAPGQVFTLDDAVFDGLRRDTATALLSAGPLARFDAPGLLAALDRYPYGCTEQVTSQALPLLYLSGVAEAAGLAPAERIDDRIQAAVTMILTRQASNGAFGLWTAGAGDFWLDAYVSDFLSRARAAGHDVPDIAFDSAMANLRNRIAYAADFDRGGEDIAYALMVLAREGSAAMGDLRYYADTKAESFATPLALAQMGAALASYGDQNRADRMFALAGQRLSDRDHSDPGVLRTDYGSDLRDAAGVLALAAGAGSLAVDRDRLADRILAAARPLSTQEQSWTLLAAHALVQDPGVSGLTVDGAPVAGPFIRRISGDTPMTQLIGNASAGPIDLTLTTLGVPDVPAPAGGYGYAIERDYFTMQGASLTGPVRRGDRLVAVLTVRPSEDTGARLMVDDPLPAGFEIDNPNVLRAGDIRALDWLEPAETRHVEFRSDRFLAAVDWQSVDPFRLAYVVRAVSPGRFHHPAASVEDMYRPQYRARSDTGTLAITE